MFKFRSVWLWFFAVAVAPRDEIYRAQWCPKNVCNPKVVIFAIPGHANVQSLPVMYVDDVNWGDAVVVQCRLR